MQANQIAILLVIALLTIVGQMVQADPETSTSAKKLTTIPKKNRVTETCEPAQRPKVLQKDVYKNKPFAPGEEAVYEVHYGVVYVGEGKLSVGPAYEFPQGSGRFNQVFDAYGKTGDWFRPIYQAENRARSVNNPANFGANWFYIDQNEGRMFDDPRVAQKHLRFQASACTATETKKKPKRKDSVRKVFFFNQSLDAMSAGFKIRIVDFKVGKKVRMPVFTSRKNWWLELDPIKEETVNTGIGSLKAMKIKMQTYLGEELQQKGEAYVWVATEHPNRPIVKVAGKVVLGSIKMRLKRYTAGR